MKPDKTVEVRQVNVVVTEGNVSEIASGISPSELVVTDGQDKLQQGSRVEPHMQSSGTQNAQSASPSQNAPAPAPLPAAPQSARRENGRSKSGNQNRGTASQ
jgi:multidrug efflux system membrane fusion protein